MMVTSDNCGEIARLLGRALVFPRHFSRRILRARVAVAPAVNQGVCVVTQFSLVTGIVPNRVRRPKQHAWWIVARARVAFDAHSCPGSQGKSVGEIEGLGSDDAD